MTRKRPSRGKPRAKSSADAPYQLAFEGASDLLALVRVSTRGTFHTERMNPSAIAFFARAIPEVSFEDWMSADMATMLRDKARFTTAQIDAILAPHREAVRTRATVSGASVIPTTTGERLERRFAITPLSDARGRVTRLLYRAEDLTGLRSAEERFQRLFDISPVPLSIVRLSDDVRLHANAAWLQFHGRSRAEAISQSATARTVWAEPEIRRRMVEELRRNGRVPGRLVRLITAGGANRDALLSMARIVWEGEECMVTATLDVSELESARRDAQASSARFTKLFELSPVPIVIGRLSDGGYLAANPAWLAMHGYRREELDGQTSLTLHAWETPEDRERVVDTLRRGGELRALPVRFRAKSGAMLDTLYYAALIEWDGETAIVAAPQDVTELMRTRREAGTQRERFESLFRLSPNPSSVTSLGEGRYLAVNESWAAAMGYTPAEMLGRTSIDLGLWVSPEARAAFARRVVEQRAVSQQQVRFRTRSGEKRDILISSEAIDWDGEKAIISSMSDVTELRRAVELIRGLNESLEQKVRERTTELEAANREMERFSYSVSHDLRAPLGAINGFANILRTKEGGRLSPDGARLLALLEAQAERMSILIDGLLEFSRLGRKPVTKIEIEMAALVAEVVEETRAAQKSRRPDLRIAPLPACRGDPILLRQVWRNLIGNAVKYSRNNPLPLIEIGHDAASSAYFVRDNGVGFDMKYADKLFGVFERLHSEAEFEGTGIGLAHAARIVERHGGRIWCDAEPGKGATFRFTLPA